MPKNTKQKKEPPSYDKILSNTKNTWKWRTWHERENPVKIDSTYANNKICLKISSKLINKTLCIRYPLNLWSPLPVNLKNKLLNNIAYAYTAHFPLVLDGNVRLEFNTEYPQVYSWSNQSFMKFLPAYWYMHQPQRGTHILPILKTILNTTHVFKPTKDNNFSFPKSSEKYVVIPFTFGKDSFLTYHLVKKLGLNPVLFWVNDPLSPYESKHKLKLFTSFSKEISDPIVCVDSELESLRDLGMDWFGWEIPLTAWAIMAMPIAARYKAKYIIFSNERSTESFFYDNDGYKVVPDYEQSTQAVDEISLLTQSLSNGNVFTTSFLQGLDEITIIAILAEEFSKNTFKNLMSCGSSHEHSKNRWCGTCSKCARLYLYLSANGVDPQKEAGFGENMFKESKLGLYNVFGQTAEGSLFDAFGLNAEEQAFAFYLCYLRGIKDPLVLKFQKTKYFTDVENRFNFLVNEYYRQHDEGVTPSVYKQALSKLCEGILAKVREKIKNLKKSVSKTKK